MGLESQTVAMKTRMWVEHTHKKCPVEERLEAYSRMYMINPTKMTAQRQTKLGGIRGN